MAKRLPDSDDAMKWMHDEFRKLVAEEPDPGEACVRRPVRGRPAGAAEDCQRGDRPRVGPASRVRIDRDSGVREITFAQQARLPLLARSHDHL